MADYVLEGPKWGSAAYGTAGGTITWAYDASLPASFAGAIAKAFATWSTYANITFQQVATTASASIDFYLGAIDGPGHVLGEAGYSFSSGRLLSASVIFDSAESWQANASGKIVGAGGADFAMVALHEIGHALGLDHYDRGPAAMNSFIDPSLTGPSVSDVHGIQALYGPSDTTSAGSSSASSVYRFFDSGNGFHFYTTSAAEKASIQASVTKLRYEGTQWATPPKSDDTVDVFRFFDTKSGDHLYTTSVGERDKIAATLPNLKFEGVAFQAYASPGHAGSFQLERFFNVSTGEHHYASSAGEIAGIRSGSAGPNWVDEGPGFSVLSPDLILV